MSEKSTIPPIRYDLMIEEVEVEGLKHLLLTDPLGIADQSVSISPEFFTFLSSIGSNFSYDEVLNEIKNDDLFKIITDSINYLDESGFLISDAYFNRLENVRTEYLALPSRPMLFSKASYPEAPEEFTEFMQDFFDFKDLNAATKDLKGLILPHIDFSIGSLSKDVYRKGYNAIRENDAELFVIFGTSHKISSDFFMLTEKPYSTPLGIIDTDIELLNILKAKLGEDLTIDDFAHKFEHSIEYQAVLLKYLFRYRNIKILPILVGTPHTFIVEGKSPSSNDSIMEFIKVLNSAIADLGRKAVYIASVDFAHIGRKFGDEFDAETAIAELRQEDAKLIEFIENGKREEFFAKITADCDKWKICGTAPIYSAMLASDSQKGELFAYNIWDEQATKSAVSFAAIGLY